MLPARVSTKQCRSLYSPVMLDRDDVFCFFCPCLHGCKSFFNFYRDFKKYFVYTLSYSTSTYLRTRASFIFVFLKMSLTAFAHTVSLQRCLLYWFLISVCFYPLSMLFVFYSVDLCCFLVATVTQYGSVKVVSYWDDCSINLSVGEGSSLFIVLLVGR